MTYLERLIAFNARAKYRADAGWLLMQTIRNKNVRVLDLGCGIGTVLDMLTHWGVRAEGLEVSQEEAEYARSQGHSVQLYCGNDLPYESRSFDVVILSHVLGHVTHPTTMLQEVYRILKPDGHLALATPNANYTNLMVLPNRFNGYTPDPTVLRRYTLPQLRTAVWRAGLVVDSHLFSGKPPSFLPRWTPPALR